MSCVCAFVCTEQASKLLNKWSELDISNVVTMWYISFPVSCTDGKRKRNEKKKRKFHFFSPLSHVHTIRLLFDCERNLSDLFAAFSSLCFHRNDAIRCYSHFIHKTSSLSLSLALWTSISTPFSLQLKNNDDDADGDGMKEKWTKKSSRIRRRQSARWKQPMVLSWLA